jgi:hypothetical protein
MEINSNPKQQFFVNYVNQVVCYLIFALVLKINSYASRIIEVEENQKIISTGHMQW